MRKAVFIFCLLFISAIQVESQVNKNVVIPLIGDVAPSFTAESTNGLVTFPDDFGNNWKIIFAHPKDFTPVCSSELLELAQQQGEYSKLGVKLIVVSTDIIGQHRDWVKALDEVHYKDREPVKIKFPLVADADHAISNKYGLIHPAVSTAENIRAVFIIDPNNIIRSINLYPIQIGRNMDEIKRTVIALQTVEKSHNVVTPANWKPGDYLMVPILTQNERAKVGKPDSEIQQVAWFMNFKKEK